MPTDNKPPKDNKPRPFPTTNHNTAASLAKRESTRVLIDQKSISRKKKW